MLLLVGYVSTYLGLIKLEACDAKSIVNAIKTMLNSKELNISKLAAIGTDNARCQRWCIRKVESDSPISD